MIALKNDAVTKSEFYTAIEALQNSLLEAIKGLEDSLELRLERKLEQKLEQKHEETRRHLGVMMEEAEERFLKTSHDQVSLNGNRIDSHETRIDHLEKIAGVV